MSILICDCGGMICADGCLDCKFKGNFKPKIMNEYAGFKVGDKVRVPKQATMYNWDYPKVQKENQHAIVFPFVGVIDEIKTVSYTNAHIDSAKTGIKNAITISGIGFALMQLIADGNIEKLPKYDAGDMVRTPFGIATVCDAPSTIWTDGYFHVRTKANGVKVIHESDLVPFDGFRVGDTVWTAKRGKGRIVSETIFLMNPSRKWIVRFDGEQKDRVPLVRNLIPTEAKYKRAIGEPTPGSFTIDIAFVTQYNPVVDVMFSPKKALNIWKYPPCPEPMPKFKVGDAVFYQGNKWEVVSIKQRTDNLFLRPHIKYDINRQVTPNGGVGACVNESDLRLWKETKFTHIAIFGNDAFVKLQKAAHFSPSDYQSCKYLGKNGQLMDVFHCSTKDTEVVILFGEKGDDC